jgi:periplasmic divalent cation tolerance protein
MSEIRLFYTTFANREQAIPLLRALITDGLIACANLYAMESMYVWEERLCAEHECMAILKTTEAMEERLRQRLAEVHPYDLPCILSWPARANAGYADWVAGGVGGSSVGGGDLPAG